MKPNKYKHDKEEKSKSAVVGSFYSDGKDYSHLKVNGFTNPEHEKCVYCGSTQTTITDNADICHNCGYVYV